MYYDELLIQVKDSIDPLFGRGKVVQYIPMLATVNPEQFGVAIATIDGHSSSIGDSEIPFSIQSIAKVFSLTLSLQLIGDEIWDRVGKNASDTPFNSITPLESEKGIPKNPFVNAGALIVVDSILSSTSRPHDDILKLVRQVSGNESINFDFAVATSEINSCERNTALAYFMKSYGLIHNDVKDILDLYCHYCSLKMTSTDVARGTLYLANRGYCPTSEKQIISLDETRKINSLLFTCGMYEASGDFAFRIGLPGKSGVGGGIFVVAPQNLTICVWSPGLDEHGNSLAGVRALELIIERTSLSVF